MLVKDGWSLVAVAQSWQKRPGRSQLLLLQLLDLKEVVREVGRSWSRGLGVDEVQRRCAAKPLLAVLIRERSCDEGSHESIHASAKCSFKV